MNLKRDDGFAVLAFSLFVAAAMAGLFVFVSGKSDRLIERYYITQGQSYAMDLSPKLAVKLRWAYDLAKTPGLCASYGGTTRNIGAVPLCFDATNKICVPHPKDASPVCVSDGDSTLIAKFLSPANRFRPSAFAHQFADWLLPSAQAAPWSPPNPPAGEISNSVALAPVCLGGGDCGAQCSVNADCLTFKFCPLTGLTGSSCKPNQFVWQTIAFLK